MALSYRIRARAKSSSRLATRSNSLATLRRMSLVWLRSNSILALRSLNVAMPIGVSSSDMSKPSTYENKDMSKSKVNPSFSSLGGTAAPSI